MRLILLAMALKRKRTTALTITEGVNTVAPESPRAWRQWLATHGEEKDGVWLILRHKKANPTCTYLEALDEALCYGWIDSLKRKRDDESFYQYFCPRRPKSNWSRVNKANVQRLEDAGRMAAPGLAAVALARELGTWSALDDVEDLVVPPDLAAAFTPVGRANWDAFPRSVRRAHLERLFSAKRDATRQKRIREIADKGEANDRS